MAKKYEAKPREGDLTGEKFTVKGSEGNFGIGKLYLKTQANFLVDQLVRRVFELLRPDGESKEEQIRELQKDFIRRVTEQLEEIGDSIGILKTVTRKSEQIKSADLWYIFSIIFNDLFFREEIEKKVRVEKLPSEEPEEVKIIKAKDESEKVKEIENFLDQMMEKLQGVDIENKEDRFLMKELFTKIVSVVKTLDKQREKGHNKKFSNKEIGKLMVQFDIFDNEKKAMVFVDNRKRKAQDVRRPFANKLCEFLRQIFDESTEKNWKALFLQEAAKNEDFFEEFEKELAGIFSPPSSQKKKSL